MNCTSCGAELQPGATFCTNCGAAAPADQYGYQDACTPEVAAQDPGKGQGLISMILGIVSLVISLLGSGSCCCCGSFVGALGIIGSAACLLPGLICSIIGLIMGGSAKKTSSAAGFENGNAKIGRILSIIALVLSVLILIAIILFFVLYFVLLIFFGGVSILGSVMDY